MSTNKKEELLGEFDDDTLISELEYRGYVVYDPEETFAIHLLIHEPEYRKLVKAAVDAAKSADTPRAIKDLLWHVHEEAIY